MTLEQSRAPISTSFADPPAEEALIAGGKVMSIFDHLAELRTRLVKSLVWIVILFILCFAFADQIIGFLKIPLQDALPPQMSALHFTSPLEVFMTNMKVAFLSAAVLSCPIWLTQFWLFFEPALYPRERKYVLPFTLISIVLFFAGVAFCFFAMLPMSLRWLINLGMQVGAPVVTISEYVSLLMVMIFSFGLVFETPVVLVLMALLGLIDADFLCKHRRLVIVAILVIAALITPPDPISQIALAIPIYVMYEAAIVIIRLLQKRQAMATAQAGVK